jgi:hypothetical protein
MSSTLTPNTIHIPRRLCPALLLLLQSSFYLATRYQMLAAGGANIKADPSSCAAELEVPEPASGERRVAVVGASLGGLAAANVLVQLGWKVDVYEKSLSTLESRGHGLGFVDVDL